MKIFGKIVTATLGFILLVLVYMVGVPNLISAQNDLLVLLGIAILLVGGLGVSVFAYTMINKDFQTDKKEDSNGK